MDAGVVLAGRYRLEGLLGRGGMGEVWRGVDTRLGREVAVKLLAGPGGRDESLVERFRREAEITARLRHSGVTVVFDVGEDGSSLFLVMELLEGEDLGTVARRYPEGMPIGRVRNMGAQVAEALHAAHGQGVVHRDVKPANVMLLPGDRVTVMDFGIAHYADRMTRLTGSGMVGTPAYMAPEQFENGTKVDGRTDLYALGGLLFVLLTGGTPFRADSMAALIRDIMLTPAPDVRSLRPDVPQDLARLVAELLAKDPGDRPVDAAVVAARLRVELDDVPEPVGSPARLRVELDDVPEPPEPVRAPVRRTVAARKRRKSVVAVTTTGEGTERTSYVVGDTGEVIVIDPAFDGAAVVDAVNGREVMAVILTSASEARLAEVLEVAAPASGGRAPIALHDADLPLWNAHFGALAAAATGRNEARALRALEPDITLAHGGSFEVGGMRLEIMHLPGQTPGSVAVLCDELRLVFCGESLYQVPLGPWFDARRQAESLRAFRRVIPASWRVLSGTGGEIVASDLRPPSRWRRVR